MTKEELAAKLSGREYMHEMTRKEEYEASEDGLVVVFGASDDLMEFRGAIDDEQGAYDGFVAYITSKGLFFNECNGGDSCPYFHRLKQQCKHTIKAIWDRDDYSWVYETDIPHAIFDIVEGPEKYCRGIVFELPVSE